MTLAPPQGAVSEAPGASGAPVVSALLVVHDGADWLPDTLAALASQLRPPDRLVVVDTGSVDGSAALVAGHGALHDTIPDLRLVEVARHTTFAAAVAYAVQQLPSATHAPHAPDSPDTTGGTDATATARVGCEWLWLLRDDTAPLPDALSDLIEVGERSASVGIAGPTLTTWSDPTRLREVGVQVTRTGRRVVEPVPGEWDQGQYATRGDVLAVGLPGMLVRCDVYAELGGFEPAFGDHGADVDLCWRTHRAGHRVVVVPTSKVRDGAAESEGLKEDGPTRSAYERGARRGDRRVALTHCSLLALPFLAVWMLVSSAVNALVLLVLKRPHASSLELSDLGALLTPWRGVGARWRARRTAVVRRRDLVRLYASGRVAWRQRLDGLHEAIELRRAPVGASAPAVAGAVAEPGPVASEAEQLDAMPPSLVLRVATHPGFLAVLATSVMAGFAWSDLVGSGAFAASGRGLAGGELLPVSADAHQLWHDALDGWHGSGLGTADPNAPYLPVLAGLSWLVQHLPFVDPAASPAGVAVGWLFLLAMPLSAVTAYVAARLATRSRWPRAVAALAWASLATLSTAVAQGRLGAVVAHVLLPLIVAGYFAAGRRGGLFSGAFATALAVAVVGAFVPAVLVVASAAALPMIVFAPGLARARALVLLVVPTALLGPWVMDAVADPTLLLTGVGLPVWAPTDAQPWQLALLHPGGPGSYPVLLSAPVVLIGLVGMFRRRPVNLAMTALGLLALLGLALGLVASHVVVGRTAGNGDLGSPITAWSGLGLDLLGLALLAAAVLGLAGIRQRWRGRWFGWRKLAVAGVLAAGAAGAVASAVMVAWTGVAELLDPAPSTMPAVAADQANGPLANRLLSLDAQAGAVLGYQLIGAEPGPVARPLPTPAADADPLLVRAVRSLTDWSNGATSASASDQLSDLAVGFVGYQGSTDDALVRRLDATAGLTRLSDSDGMVLWRVLPRQGTASATATGDAEEVVPPLSVAPGRARLEDTDGAPQQQVDVTGPHAGIDTRLADSVADRNLVLAEPPGWTRYADVSFNGRILPALPDAAQPTYELPGATGDLQVVVRPARPEWRWAQLALLVAVIFLAVPFGRSRRRS